MVKECEKGNEEAKNHMELFKISILSRLEDFDAFFDLHFEDDRISYFETQKFRLRQLLYEAGKYDGNIRPFHTEVKEIVQTTNLKNTKKAFNGTDPLRTGSASNKKKKIKLQTSPTKVEVTGRSLPKSGHLRLKMSPEEYKSLLERYKNKLKK